MKILAASLCAVLAFFTATARAQNVSGGHPNLLSNPSFEEGQTGWEPTSFRKLGTITVDNTEFRNGKASIRIDNPSADDMFLTQTVQVKPQTRYKMSGYIKCKDVVVKGNVGANIAIRGGEKTAEPMVKSKGWTHVSFEFDSGPLDSIKIGPRLGHNFTIMMGTAWFDDLSLVELGPSRKR